MVDRLREADWDIPLTDEFVAGVQRGVRRRRAVRRAVAGGALVCVLLLTLTLVGGRSDRLVVAAPKTSAATGGPLDGYQLHYVPDGVRADAGTSSGLCGFAGTEVACLDHAEPSATVTFRRYDQDGALWLWVAVLRPLAGQPASITDRLVAWQTAGTQPVARFDAPAGAARIVQTVGSEVTVHRVVIEADSGAVIAIDGNAGVSVEEFTKVAQNLRSVR